MCVIIPASPLQKEPKNIDPFLGGFVNFAFNSIINDLEFKVQLIDRNSVLPCVILKSAREKRMRKKEPTHPKDLRNAILHPLIEHSDSFH